MPGAGLAAVVVVHVSPAMLCVAECGGAWLSTTITISWWWLMMDMCLARTTVEIYSMVVLASQ